MEITFIFKENNVSAASSASGCGERSGNLRPNSMKPGRLQKSKQSQADEVLKRL